MGLSAGGEIAKIAYVPWTSLHFCRRLPFLRLLAMGQV